MRRSHLRPAAAAAAVALTFCLAVTAPAARAADPIMPLGDVRAGMACTALSVIQGLEPTTFSATVLGVDGGPRPSDALIIMRFSGDAINATGIGQGFSGSPVSCPGADGVTRVVGAISQGLGQYDNLVAGVTPIEAMLATPTYGTAPAAPAIGQPIKKRAKPASATRARRAATTASSPWGTGRAPLTLSGPRGALAVAFQSAAHKAGYPLLIGPTATRAQAPSGGLKGGDAVAASVVTGDVTAGAIGTVTYVDGPRVWAFGHPYNGTGPARLLMERAQITTIIGSPAIGDQVTYKLGSPVGPVGTVGFDGVAAIGGVLGASPNMIQTTATIRDAGGAVVQEATANIVDERSVRAGSTGDLLALGAAANAGTALQRLTTQSAVGGAARTCTTIVLKNGQKPLSQCVDSVVPQPSTDGGVETGVADAVAAAIGPLTTAERFLGLVEKVTVDVRLRREADSLEVLKISTPQHPKAGRFATVRVLVVQSSTGERREIAVKVRIPKDAAGERTGITVLADPASGAPGDASLEELFAADSESEPAPRSLEALRALYTPAGLSGLRAIAVPGLSGRGARDAVTGNTDNLDLSASEIAALAKRVKLVWELPTVLTEGSAAITVTPRS